ncbi:MAG TPA: tyrosine-type recombinase/integrase [Candidatus Dormibacteraeota bacterium]|nr:tyrosine-type recombinase/integrase [Candidatus Dormibacteraeota bacterium]
MATSIRARGAGGATTWVVLDRDHRTVEQIEEYLEFARSQFSPNTVKSYAYALSLWWSYLEAGDYPWEQIGPGEIGLFLASLRSHVVAGSGADRRPLKESTIAVRLKAVSSFYQYHSLAHHVGVVDKLLQANGWGGRKHYRPFLEHVAWRSGRPRLRVRARPQHRPIQILSPTQMAVIANSAGHFDPAAGEWFGSLRNRLFWKLLEETGLRIGEALSLQHRDWRSGHGEPSYVTVEPRPHPRGIQQKSGYRQVFIGSELDQLYAEYLFQLVEVGIDGAVDDIDWAYIFCNLARPPLFAPLSPDTIYDQVNAPKRRHPDLPSEWTPHWFRHTHATALLLAGIEPIIVSRRLGHKDVQTTLNTYGHVTEDVQLKALANWHAYTRPWALNR